MSRKAGNIDAKGQLDKETVSEAMVAVSPEGSEAVIMPGRLGIKVFFRSVVY